MNITKNQWIIGGIVVAFIIFWYFFLRNKKSESSYQAGGGTKTCDCCNKSSLACLSGYCGICCEDYGGTKAAGCGQKMAIKNKTLTNN